MFRYDVVVHYENGEDGVEVEATDKVMAKAKALRELDYSEWFIENQITRIVATKEEELI